MPMRCLCAGPIAAEGIYSDPDQQQQQGVYSVPTQQASHAGDVIYASPDAGNNAGTAFEDTNGL